MHGICELKVCNSLMRPFDFVHKLRHDTLNFTTMFNNSVRKFTHKANCTTTIDDFDISVHQLNG